MKCILMIFIISWQLHGQERLTLWPENKAPISVGVFENKKVFITVHKAKTSKPAPAVVICPGGGYGMLAMRGEGHTIAKWLNKRGITGVVLEYRLPRGRFEVPLLDTQRTLRTVRYNAKKWGVNPNQIGIIGFSAGGHLASTASTQFDRGQKDSQDEIQRVSCRPDFAILVYPVVSMGKNTHGGSRKNLMGKAPSKKLMDRFSAEKRVTDSTPPIFLTHAQDDRVVLPINSQELYEALVAHKIKATYLKLASGGHGLNGYKGPMWDAWQKQSINWLLEEKIISVD